VSEPVPRSVADPALSVVMPVCDEEAVIADVVAEWVSVLDGLGVPYEMRVYDDGSRDRTPEILGAALRAHPRATVVRHANRGHGPTIYDGYRAARGEWVLQVDADGESPAAAFHELWSRRDAADVVVGWRDGRTAPPGRRLLTAMSRLTARVLFGCRVRDVNCPYRLYRRTALARLLPAVPADAFAPNVILVGLAARLGLRIVEVQVPGSRTPVRRRRTSRRFWWGAVRSFAQTIRVAATAR